MKSLLIIIFLLGSIICYPQKDSTAIHQEVFFSFGVYHLLTTDFSIYDNVVHGSFEFVEGEKIIEYNKALARRRPVAIITAKCK